MTDSKPCAACGKIFTRDARTRKQNWRQKRYCDVGCRAKNLDKAEANPRADDRILASDPIAKRTRPPTRWNPEHLCREEMR